jgi:hypothetical protein
MGNAYRENEKYEDMLIRLENRSKGINISSRDVPATVQFILNEKEKVVGTIDIRHTLNDNYFSRLGHIAYYIKLEERNKGYATEALKLALEKLKIEYKVNKNRMFLDVLDEMLTNERSSLKDIEERFVATVACKAAVKAGMDLSRQEVENLISSLLGLKNPYTCPHGRPTTIKIDIH